MPYVVAQPCVDVKDKACVDECPVDCIYEGSRSLYINPNECVDCGACEPVCPTEAIFYEDDLPDEWLGTRTPPSASSPKSAIWVALPQPVRSARIRNRSRPCRRRTSEHVLLMRPPSILRVKRNIRGRF